MRVLLVVLTVVLASPTRADDLKLSIADLEVLDKQQAWDELARHLEDIPPSKRDARWQAILERTALGTLAARAADPSAAMAAADRFTRRFPTVKKSRDFMTRRADAGLAALEKCTKRDDHDCAARFLDYADADPGNQSLALRAGALIASTSRPSLAVALFRRGLAGRKAAKECADTSLARAVHAALLLPPADPAVADAKELAANMCWDALSEGLVTQHAVAGNAYRINTCDLLIAKNALSALSTKLCRQLKP